MLNPSPEDPVPGRSRQCRIPAPRIPCPGGAGSAESQPRRGGGRRNAWHGERMCLLRTRSWGLLILFIYSILRFIKRGTGAFPSLVCVEGIQAPHTTCRNVITRCVK